MDLGLARPPTKVLTVVAAYSGLMAQQLRAMSMSFAWARSACFSYAAIRLLRQRELCVLVEGAKHVHRLVSHLSVVALKDFDDRDAAPRGLLNPTTKLSRWAGRIAG
jgi:hypothetical protein